MGINLYTSRIILEAIGESDYGVYNVVGGFISMFSIISASLSTAISRYLMVSLEKDSIDKLKNVFSTSIIIQLILGIIVIILVESFGIWFLNYKMNIPENRMIAANWVLQFSLFTFVFNLLNVPYNAALIAHERMKAFAYIGIFEGFTNLLVAFLIQWSSCDKLILYSGLMCIVAVIVRLAYWIYCKNNFQECFFHFKIDKNQLKEMFGFAGWNFIGSISGILRSQGLNILFNIYNGTVINAARGLSVQVETAVTRFSSSFYTAVQPQITKSIATDEKKQACELACRSARLAFFLLCILCLPIIFNSNFILTIWLKDVPEYTSQFVEVILFYTLIESFSQPLIQLMLGNGKIKKYQIVVGSVILLNFPLGWFLLYIGISPVIVQASIIFFSIIALFIRTYMLKSMIDFPIGFFYKDTVFRCIFILLIISIIATIVKTIAHTDFQGFIISTLIIEISAFIAISIFGLSRNERNLIFSKLKNLIKVRI